MFFGLSYIKLIGVGIGVALLASAFFYVRHLQHENKTLTEQKATLQAQLSTAEAIAKNNAQMIQQQKAQAQVNQKAVSDNYERRIDELKSKNKILEEIANAKPEDDGPVAPVLERTVRQLYLNQTTAGADSGDTHSQGKGSSSAP